MTRRRTLEFAKDHDQQLGCPLFTRIPAELRNIIFTLALLRYDLEPFTIDTYYTRPGYMHRKRINTSLLVTCRRIYLETHLVPLRVNEHVFWCFRGPPHSNSDPRKYFSNMTKLQRRAAVRAHFFTQMYWLEYRFSLVCRLREMKYITHLKITVRQSDWWYWEINHQLHMRKEWTSGLRKLKNLQELVVELECIDRDKDRLDAIAAMMATWKFDIRGRSVPLSTNGADIVCSRWVSPSSSHGIYYYDAEKKLWQRVNRSLVLTFQKLFQQDPGLSLYGLTLTWRAQDEN